MYCLQMDAVSFHLTVSCSETILQDVDQISCYTYREPHRKCTSGSSAVLTNTKKVAMFKMPLILIKENSNKHKINQDFCLKTNHS